MESKADVVAEKYALKTNGGCL